MDPLRASNKLRRLIRAYHGSPHSFSRFDASKIGTGEGAQAYGHGMYFAGNEGVARGYRDKLSSGSLIVEGAESPLTEQSMRDMGLGHGAIGYIRGAVIDGRDPVAALRQVQSFYPVLSRRHNEMADAIAFLEGAKGPLRKHAGHMYEVEIGYPEEALLDWDKPVGAELAGRLDSRMAVDLAAEAQRMADMGQLPRHMEALKRIASGEVGLAPGEMVYRAAGRFDTPATKLDLASVPSVPRGWGSVTNTINDSLTNQAKATERLMESGIPGIRYLDQGSRSAGWGTRNYVMFPGTEDRIRILRKYGLLPPLAGAGAMGGEE